MLIEMDFPRMVGHCLRYNAKSNELHDVSLSRWIILPAQIDDLPMSIIGKRKYQLPKDKQDTFI